MGQAAGAQEANARGNVERRLGYVIDVPLPIVGTRDEVVERQITQIASQTRGDESRPIVVLKFALPAATAVDSENAKPQSSRGSRFERALSLARFLTSPAASRVRLVALVTDSVEGHAVLPVLACESIVVTEAAELGRAAIDEPSLDETVRSAYRDISKRRGVLSEAIVDAMLSPDVEVLRVDLLGGETRYVTASDYKQLQADGRVVGERTFWSGGSQAAFSGPRMKSEGWADHLVRSEEQLSELLGVAGRLQEVRLRPETWKSAMVDLVGKLDDSRINQIIRAIEERRERDHINLLVVRLDESQARLDGALRLANHIAQLKNEGVSTVGLIESTVNSPALLAAFACEQVFALNDVSIGPDPMAPDARRPLSKDEASQRALIELDKTCGRPAALMAVSVDRTSDAKIYVDQQTGKRVPLTQWQLAMLPNSDGLIAKESLTDGGVIAHDIASRYGLVDRWFDDRGEAFSALGLESNPPVVEGPWLESAIGRVLANAWLPRLLVTLGFVALMMELGSPGLGVGGFIAAVCFVGFFWIEMLQGNVEWLEVLLFVGGLACIAIEIFVLPGFGIFGIGGLVMVFSSIVLASQTFVIPTNSQQLSVVANNLFWMAMSALIVMVGLVAMRKQLENIPVFRWMTLQPAGIDDLDELEQREAIVHWEHLLGQDGITTTRLNPAGKAQFGRQIVNVLGTNMLAEGVLVRVVEVRGNSIFVEPLES